MWKNVNFHSLSLLELSLQSDAFILKKISPDFLSDSGPFSRRYMAKSMRTPCAQAAVCVSCFLLISGRINLNVTQTNERIHIFILMFSTERCPEKRNNTLLAAHTQNTKEHANTWNWIHMSNNTKLSTDMCPCFSCRLRLTDQTSSLSVQDFHWNVSFKAWEELRWRGGPSNRPHTSGQIWLSMETCYCVRWRSVRKEGNVSELMLLKFNTDSFNKVLSAVV